PAADKQDVGVERFGQRLVESAGVELGRTRTEPLDDDNIGSVINRLAGSDDLLEHDLESARSELLLQLGAGEWIRGTQRSYSRDQCGRAVRATIGPGLSHRLDEVNVHTPPVQRPHQTEASPGPADASRVRHDQQG